MCAWLKQTDTGAAVRGHRRVKRLTRFVRLVACRYLGGMTGEADSHRPVADDTATRQTAEAGDAEPIHLVVAKLAHELSEALTAANGYLHASQHLDSPGELHMAIGKAIGQVNRAADNVVRLRSVASGQ